MLKTKIEQKIDRKLDSFEEDLKYAIDAITEAISGLQCTRYLRYLVKTQDEEQNEPD